MKRFIYLLIIAITFPLLVNAQEDNSDVKKNAPILSTHIQAGYSTPVYGDADEKNGLGFSVDFMYSPKFCAGQLSAGVVFQGNILCNNQKWFGKTVGKDSRLSYVGAKIRYDIKTGCMVQPYFALSFGKAYYVKQSTYTGIATQDIDEVIQERQPQHGDEWTSHTQLSCIDNADEVIYHYISYPQCLAYAASQKNRYDRCALGTELGVSIGMFTFGVVGLIPKDFFIRKGSSVYPLQMNFGVKIPIK